MRTIKDLRRWAEEAPSGTSIPAASLAEALGLIEEAAGPGVNARSVVDDTLSATWRERLWTCPADTRLGVVEVAEALGRPKSFVYARTAPKAEDPIPHRKLDGAIVFTAGGVRAWIEGREDVAVAGPPALRVS